MHIPFVLLSAIYQTCLENEIKLTMKDKSEVYVTNSRVLLVRFFWNCSKIRKWRSALRTSVRIIIRRRCHLENKEPIKPGYPGDKSSLARETCQLIKLIVRAGGCLRARFNGNRISKFFEKRNGGKFANFGSQSRLI